ncbi:murein hydrolase activator EnvC family protein [Sulfurovum sp. ST-21]|uniref:Peptidoglycan DD-metalloendopeptidase family protein n=1 Tax=Sulfurovum indicum TaxID=2779528 RepID=A0A7M1S6B5_9BACT|nr:peptidoglycan DD-metalloendopeptidase family protein [Sulfurovum indicum]QOR62511.1 peptidoglycan DD-metalloendopeptidase family protein [Sulfurovum indicum]
MRALILYLFLAASLVCGASSTTKKISVSKKHLSKVQKEQKQASRRLDKIAKDIKAAEKEITYLEKKIDLLAKDQNVTEASYHRLKKELKYSENELARTGRELEKKRKQFISLLSERFSVIFAMEKAHEPTKKSIIDQEVYRVYKVQNTKMLAALKKEISILKKKKEDTKYRRNKTRNQLARIIKKRESYAQKKKQKEKLLKKLEADEEKYTAKLQKIVDKQNALRTTLAKLNILHKKEVEEARKRAAARKEALRLEKERKRKLRLAKAKAKEKERKALEALKRAKTEEARKRARMAAKEAESERKKIAKESQKVRNINSSYKKEAVYRYRGGKTISPIAGARVIKKFGTYVDPIYKIKIFNESITLQAPSSPAKVKNVLNGKVVFAGKSSMLGKVVVVAHSGKMHTVYAGLSKIAPTIRVGTKIRKGYVVGKVKSKLVFQATKNSKHINPLKLIRI